MLFPRKRNPGPPHVKLPWIPAFAGGDRMSCGPIGRGVTEERRHGGIGRRCRADTALSDSLLEVGETARHLGVAAQGREKALGQLLMQSRLGLLAAPLSEAAVGLKGLAEALDSLPDLGDAGACERRALAH